MPRRPRYTATHVHETAIDRRPSIHGPEDIVDVFREAKVFEPFEQERFFAILLDTKHHVIETPLIAQGTLASALVHPRDVFRAAVRANVATLVIVHSHPSGDSTPSREDIEITRRLHDAGELLGIKLLDHIIIGLGYTFTSLKARGDLQ